MNSSDDRPSMELTKTDRVGLLGIGGTAVYYLRALPQQAQEGDVARRMRLMIKKLLKQQERK